MSERLDGSIFGAGQPCFGCAPDHPFGFRLGFTRDGDEIVTRMTPTEQHQGPPGIMHGGLVATLDDEVGAWACIAALGKFGFTVTFSVRLHQAVHIGREVEARARISKAGSRFVDVEVKVSQDAQTRLTGAFHFLLLGKSDAEKLLGRPLPQGWSSFAR